MQTVVSNIAKLLVCIFRSIDEFCDNSEVLAHLKQMSIIPLVNGDMVALQDHAVFFPLIQDQSMSKTQAHTGIGATADCFVFN